MHIGAHRTGTTTFQRFLTANRGHLRRQGIAIWTPDRTRGGLFRGLMRPPPRVTPEDDRLAARSRGRIAIEIARLQQKGVHTLIVSEENMIGGMPNNLVTERLYPFAAERLGRMARAFAPHPVRVGLGIRSYDRHWGSMLSYCVKQGYGVPDADSLQAIATQPVRWMRVIRQAAAAFPQAKLVVWPFEALIGLPEAQLAALVGRRVEGPFRARREWHNASPSVPDLRALAAAQAGGGAALAHMGTDLGRWHPFNDAQTALMRAAYAQDLAWLRGGADGLATYFDRPELEGTASGRGRGRHNDERQTGMG